MANKEHLAILKQGVEVWNEWRKSNPDMRVDLDGAELEGSEFIGADFSGVTVRSADFSKASLRGAEFHRAELAGIKCEGADLSSAEFCEANLWGANLSATNLRLANLLCADATSADLRGANLLGADLVVANLSYSTLRGANLSRVRFNRTIFGSTDLSDAIGLNDCRIEGPCIVDHATIERSGQLPLSFLRGCGLPDALIDYLPSLLNQPIQYYSCFISYSTKDDEFAHRVHADLQNKGVRCWFAPHGIAGGKKIHEQIDEAIRSYERLLLILSEHSMESNWVAREVLKATERAERERRRVLFPITLVDYARVKVWELFDADRGKDLAKEIREYFIPDFTHWKDHDAYTESFERLLKDLKAETTASKES